MTILRSSINILVSCPSLIIIDVANLFTAVSFKGNTRYTNKSFVKQAIYDGFVDYDNNCPMFLIGLLRDAFDSAFSSKIIKEVCFCLF